MRTWAKLFLVVCVVSGAGLAVVAEHRQRASAAPVGYYVWVHPGGTSYNGSTDYLNCGWHDVCLSPYNLGDALDWQNAPGEWVYYRARSYNAAGHTWFGRGLVTDWGETCRKTYVTQYRRSGAHDSTVKYSHTGSNYHGYQFYINSSRYNGLLPGAWTSLAIANTMDESGLPCQTTAPHLHQETDFGQNHWINPTRDFPNAGGTGG